MIMCSIMKLALFSVYRESEESWEIPEIGVASSARGHST